MFKGLWTEIRNSLRPLDSFPPPPPPPDAVVAGNYKNPEQGITVTIPKNLSPEEAIRQLREFADFREKLIDVQAEVAVAEG